MCDRGVDETGSCDTGVSEVPERKDGDGEGSAGMGWDVNGRITRTERKWMVLLLELNAEASERVIEAMKSFVEMWCVSNRIKRSN